MDRKRAASSNKYGPNPSVNAAVNPVYEPDDHQYEDHTKPTLSTNTDLKADFKPAPYAAGPGVDSDPLYEIPDPEQATNTLDKPRKCMIIGIVVCLVLVIAIALGVGLGVGLKQSDTSTVVPKEFTSTSTSTIPTLTDAPVIIPISWTTWSKWSICGATCGGGNQSRSRICNGLSNNDVRRCAGKPREQRECAVWRCPDCNLDCPSGSSLNDACDTCECTGSKLTGRVTDEQNRPLSGANIYYSILPNKTLATTDSTGEFLVSDVCYISQRMLVKKNMYVSNEMNTTVEVDNTMSTLHVTLQRMELPFIGEQPQNKVRRTGDTVRFCCFTDSTSPIIKFEWFKNGDIIESSNAESESFVIDDLTTDDAGTYTCRVENEFGAVYSDAATLSIMDSVNTCITEPTTQFVRLPSDCIQQDINKAEYDVGTCGQTECPGTKTDQTSCTDSPEELYCCQPTQTEIVKVTCDDYTIPVTRVVSCGCGKCIPKLPRIIGHVVSSETGEDLEYIVVHFNSTQVTGTDSNGIFSYEFPTQVRRVALTLKDVYFKRVIDTTVVIEISSSFVTYQIFKMKAMPSPMTLQSNVENCLPLSGEGSDAVAEIVIPPDSMYDKNGIKYDGQFNSVVMNIDMRNTSDAEIAPGDFTTIDEEGNVAELRSYGMFALSFTDMQGNQLSVGGSSMVRVNPKMIPSCTNDEDGACSTSLWVLSEKSGTWQMASSLTQESGGRRRRQDANVVTGEIDIETRWYNIDDLDSNVQCWAKVISYTSNDFNEQLPLPNNVVVTSVIREEGTSFLRRSFPAFGSRNTDGVCIPQACDTTNPNNSRFTTYLTATYNEQELIPAPYPNPSPNFSLDQNDINILQYQTSGAQLTMKPFATVAGGPVFDGKSNSQCYTAGTDQKHFQFYCPTCDPIICNTVHSASDPSKRTYLTFYPQLAFNKDDQDYCFIGLRIFTAVSFVRVAARSNVGTFIKIQGGNTQYGSREIIARKVNAQDAFIDACMEYKCSGTVFNPLNSGTDRTSVTIEIKDAGNCRVTQVAPDFGTHLGTTGVSVPFDLPFTFDDANTYGQRQGLHKINGFNNVPQCANDDKSPQATETDHCKIGGTGFVAAVDITCTQ